MADSEPAKTGGIDWIEVSKVVALPLVTLIVGYLFNTSLNERADRDSNVRLYADMMGRREEADSALRKDMFKSILDTFLRKDPNQPHAQYLETEVLNIELLAYNFHESLDLGPLFKHVKRELAESDNHNVTLLPRLERVAADVKTRQLEVLSDSGEGESGWVDRETQAWTGFFGSMADRNGTGQRVGPVLCMVLATSTETHYRQFKIQLVDFKPEKKEAEIILQVSKPLPKDNCWKIPDAKVEQDNKETESHFWVGLFAFPMIDNTHLTHNERCAVSLTSIGEQDNLLGLTVSYFRASRASLKDKPYYDEVLHDLIRNPAKSSPNEE